MLLTLDDSVGTGRELRICEYLKCYGDVFFPMPGFSKVLL